jgi:hypothetical protein
VLSKKKVEQVCNLLVCGKQAANLFHFNRCTSCTELRKPKMIKHAELASGKSAVVVIESE